VNLRDGSLKEKQTIIIGDESKTCISVTFWGDVCKACKFRIGQVIALKQCRVSEYSGRTLNASGDIKDIFIDFDHPRAKQVSLWSAKSSST